MKHWRKNMLESEMLIEKTGALLVRLYLKHGGDLDAVHRELLRTGWQESGKSRGIFYNPTLSNTYVFFCQPSQLELWQDIGGRDPVWGRPKGEGTDARLPRHRWEKILEPLWR